MAMMLKKNSELILCRDFKIASSFFDRLIGLMFSKKMKDFDGLLIKHCQSIHTFFMFYSIDVVFLDSKYRVIKIIHQLKPWRLTWFYWRASQVLELPGNTVGESLQVGDYLEVKCTN